MTGLAGQTEVRVISVPRNMIRVEFGELDLISCYHKSSFFQSLYGLLFDILCQFFDPFFSSGTLIGYPCNDIFEDLI